jgi:hypothetical protein
MHTSVAFRVTNTERRILTKQAEAVHDERRERAFWPSRRPSGERPFPFGSRPVLDPSPFLYGAEPYAASSGALLRIQARLRLRYLRCSGNSSKLTVRTLVVAPRMLNVSKTQGLSRFDALEPAIYLHETIVCFRVN